MKFNDDATKLSFDALPSKKNAGTIPAGERMHAGDVLVPAGTRIDPLLAATIASGNNSDVRVVAKPRVGFLPTGNELVPVGEDVPRGGNIDSNSLLMKGKIEQWGGQAVLYPIVRDKPEAIREALLRAVGECDIVVLNAGSSKGSDDWNLEVVEELGRVLCHQTNHGPGHHSSFSVIDGTPIVGISGPPGGAAITVDFYLKPVMSAFLGLPTEPVQVTARLMAPFPVGHGPGHKGTAVVQSAHLPGEKRPKETGQFFSIRQMKLVPQEDGVMGAYPLSSPRPKPIEAAKADAYYLLDTTLGKPAPEPGALIHRGIARLAAQSGACRAACGSRHPGSLRAARLAARGPGVRWSTAGGLQPPRRLRNVRPRRSLQEKSGTGESPGAASRIGRAVSRAGAISPCPGSPPC